MFDEEAVGCNVDTIGFVTAVFVGTNGFVELIG